MGLGCKVERKVRSGWVGRGGDGVMECGGRVGRGGVSKSVGEGVVGLGGVGVDVRRRGLPPRGRVGRGGVVSSLGGGVFGLGGVRVEVHRWRLRLLLLLSDGGFRFLSLVARVGGWGCRDKGSRMGMSSVGIGQVFWLGPGGGG